MKAPSPAHRRGRARRRPARVFAAAFALVFVAMALWSAATPLYAAPDEPVQVIKAAAVVRGELVGRTAGASQTAFALVTVPAFYGVPANRNSPTCFHHRPTVPASCAPALAGGTRPVSAWIYVARYPPLYYLIVGLPSLLGTGGWAIYLMRLVSALLSAVFIGLAAMAAVRWSASRLALVGVAVATTPMVLFMGGVVNPSGLEISAAICVWTAGAILVLEHLDDPPPGLLAVLAVSACVLELVRALSPFWLALTALCLLGVSDPKAVGALMRRRQPRLVAAAVLVAGALALAWIFGEHATAVYSNSPLGPTPELTILETSFAHNRYYLPDMIGVFGWFDTYAPLFTYVVWYGLAGLVAVLAAVLGRRRDAAVIAALTAAIVLVPVAISSSQVHRYGYTWQGRDTLPLAVGLPILSCALLGTTPLSVAGRRLAGAVGVLAASAQLAAFFEALRRYAVGTRGADFAFVLHPSWTPPGGFGLLLAGEVVVLVAGAAALVAGVGGRLRSPRARSR